MWALTLCESAGVPQQTASGSHVRAAVRGRPAPPCALQSPLHGARESARAAVHVLHATSMACGQTCAYILHISQQRYCVGSCLDSMQACSYEEVSYERV